MRGIMKRLFVCVWRSAVKNEWLKQHLCVLLNIQCSVRMLFISKPSISKQVILQPDAFTIKLNPVVSERSHTAVQTRSCCLCYIQMKASRH